MPVAARSAAYASARLASVCLAFAAAAASAADPVAEEYQRALAGALVLAPSIEAGAQAEAAPALPAVPSSAPSASGAPDGGSAERVPLIAASGRAAWLDEVVEESDALLPKAAGLILARQAMAAGDDGARLPWRAGVLPGVLLGLLASWWFVRWLGRGERTQRFLRMTGRQAIVVMSTAIARRMRRRGGGR